MIGEQSITVFKKTGTYAETLLVYGLAYLIGLAFRSDGDGDSGVVIEDTGPSYQIKLPRLFTKEDLKKIPVGPHYPYVKLKSQDEGFPGAVDYDAERQKELQFRQTRDGLIKQYGVRIPPELADQLNNIRSDRNFPIFKAIRALKGFDAYNAPWPNLLSMNKKDFYELIETGIQGLVTDSKPNVNKRGVKSSLKASTVQVFNPSAGKGINRLKADGTSLAGLPRHHSDGFFAEWMRFIGINRGAFAALFGKKGEHAKIYVISPRRISAGTASEVRDRFWKKASGHGPVARDIMGSLGVAEALVECSIEEPGAFHLLLGKRPRDLLAGLHVAFFRSLGQAKGLANLSFIGLPGWFSVLKRKDADDFLSIIKEHRWCLTPLDENKGDELSLLEQYRLFLSSDDLYVLLNFLGSWASHLIRTGQEKDVRRRARQFHQDNLRRLIVGMEKKLSEIVESSLGFKNLAAAIRLSTIYAQRYKGEKNAFEIRYGLAQEWKRRAKFNTDFVVALCDFVNSYNAENYRYYEKQKSFSEHPRFKGKVISQQDLKEVIGLIDDHGSELICLLLLAFGYAGAGKKGQKTEADTDSELVLEDESMDVPDENEEEN